MILLVYVSYLNYLGTHRKRSVREFSGKLTHDDHRELAFAGSIVGKIIRRGVGFGILPKGCSAMIDKKLEKETYLFRESSDSTLGGWEVILIIRLL
jgi:hypothetical protein